MRFIVNVMTQRARWSVFKAHTVSARQLDRHAGPHTVCTRCAHGPPAVRRLLFACQHRDTGEALAVATQ